MPKFFFPPPKQIAEVEEIDLKTVPKKKPGKLLRLLFSLLALYQLVLGLIPTLIVYLVDRHFAEAADLRINYYAQTEPLLWIYAIVALAAAIILAFLSEKLLTGTKNLFWISLVFLVLSTFVCTNLYWNAFSYQAIILPNQNYINIAIQLLVPWVNYGYLALSGLTIFTLLSSFPRFNFPSGYLEQSSKRFFGFVLFIGLIGIVFVYMSLTNGFSNDYGYKTIDAKGRYHLYRSYGENEGLLPISELSESKKTIAQQTNAVVINYGTPFLEIAQGKENFTTKATLTLVGLSENIDLESYVHSLPKTIANAKPVKPILGSHRTRFGYLISYRGVTTLIFVTEDNVMVQVASAYLSEAQILNFANNLK